MQYLLAFAAFLVAFPVFAIENDAACDRSRAIVENLELQLKKPCQQITTQDISSLTEVFPDVLPGDRLREDDLRGMTSLESFSIVYGAGDPRHGLAPFPAKLFRMAPRLKELHSWGAFGWTGNEPHFRALLSGAPQLRFIDLKNSGSPELSLTSPETFGSLCKLEKLYLEDLMVRGIGDGIFSRLKSLQELTLDRIFTDQSQENFITVPAGLLSGLNGLKSLFFQPAVVQGIRNPSRSLFSSLRSAEVITLGFFANTYENAPAGMFLGLSKVRRFESARFHYSRVSDVPVGLFRGLEGAAFSSVAVCVGSGNEERCQEVTHP